MMNTNVVLVGVQHPHMFARIEYLQENLNLIGFYDDDVETAEKLALKYPSFKRFLSLSELLHFTTTDACFIHALDHDVPRYAREVLKICPDIKGLFLEKPGAAVPDDLFQLNEDLKAYPNVVVEFGWEMHYGEVMDFSREIISKKALGDITLAHFHGGTPSGGALEKWQCLDTTLGGFVYTDASHTFEEVLDLFGLPNQVVASVRKLPEGTEDFTCVSFIEDLFAVEKVNSAKARVGRLKWEDIGSVILEYTDKNIVCDFTAWEAKPWCADWTTDIYGTNGIFHSFLNPPIANLFLREARAGFKAGDTKLETMLPEHQSNSYHYFVTQVVEFLKRCDGKSNSSNQICGMEKEVELMKLLEAVFKSAEERKFVKVRE